LPTAPNQDLALLASIEVPDCSCPRARITLCQLLSGGCQERRESGRCEHPEFQRACEHVKAIGEEAEAALFLRWAQLRSRGILTLAGLDISEFDAFWFWLALAIGNSPTDPREDGSYHDPLKDPQHRTRIINRSGRANILSERQARGEWLYHPDDVTPTRPSMIRLAAVYDNAGNGRRTIYRGLVILGKTPAPDRPNKDAGRMLLGKWRSILDWQPPAKGEQANDESQPQ